MLDSQVAFVVETPEGFLAFNNSHTASYSNASKHNRKEAFQLASQYLHATVKRIHRWGGCFPVNEDGRFLPIPAYHKQPAE